MATIRPMSASAGASRPSEGLASFASAIRSKPEGSNSKSIGGRADEARAWSPVTPDRLRTRSARRRLSEAMDERKSVTGNLDLVQESDGATVLDRCCCCCDRIVAFVTGDTKGE